MTRKQYLLVAILLVGGAVLLGLAIRPRTATIRVVLSGPEGLQIRGSLSADGQEHDVNETLPTEITITAKRLSLLVESSQEKESLSAKVFVNGKRRISGAQRHIQVNVTGNTAFSPPRTFLKAYQDLEMLGDYH